MALKTHKNYQFMEQILIMSTWNMRLFVPNMTRFFMPFKSWLMWKTYPLPLWSNFRRNNHTKIEYEKIKRIFFFRIRNFILILSYGLCSVRCSPLCPPSISLFLRKIKVGGAAVVAPLLPILTGVFVFLFFTPKFPRGHIVHSSLGHKLVVH